MTKDMAQRPAQMSAGINDDLFGAGRKRTPETVTPTTFETFADVFARIYRSQAIGRFLLNPAATTAMNCRIASSLIESGLHKEQHHRIAEIWTCAELDVGVLCNKRMAVMDQQTAVDLPENDPTAFRGDNREPKVPCRCKDCPDSVLCDFDYCLHWWH